jgi:hypothetical protein
VTKLNFYNREPTGNSDIVIEGNLMALLVPF